MDLFDDEELFKEQKKKVRRNSVVIISCIVVAVILIIGIVCAMMYFQSLEWGITVDGMGMPLKETTIITDEQTGKIFVSVSDVAPRVKGYQYLNGEYGQNTEDPNSGVVQCADEVVEIKANENKINKILLKEDTKDNEYGYMYLSEKIKYANGQLYAYVEDLQVLLNAKINYNQATNKIVLVGTEYLYEQYQTKIASLGYNSVDSNFVNKKALASDMIVARKDNGLIGIIRPDGKEIAGARYESVQWLETTEEFLVESNDKYGIISELGQSKISMNYDSIKLLDKDTGLYIVRSSNKYGVINKSERQILYSEYDQIGVNKDQYPSLKNENQYLFYDSIIPVQRDEKWGLFNINGEMILPIEYASIGCIVSSQQTKSANNAILLEEYEGIIVGKQISENDRNKKYAVYNPLGEQLVDFVLDNIYYRTENGKDVYYLEMGGQQGNLDEVFKANGIKKVNTNINDSNLNNNMNINNGTSNPNELVKN